MRTHLVRRLSLVAVALAPAAASALAANARAGVVYSRFDARPHDAPSATAPHLDVDLALDARGVIVSREVVAYSLAAAWGRSSFDYVGGSRTTHLTFNGSASVLNNEKSPVGLSLFASRGETDFATSGVAGAFGSGFSTSAGGSTHFRRGGYPSLTGSYSWTESNSRIAGQPLRTTTTHVVASTLQMTAPTLSISADYGGEFRDGSWEFDRAQEHRATLSGRALVGKQYVSFAGASRISFPPALVPGTVKQQATSFETAFSANAERRRSVRYIFGQALVESPGFPTRETERQSLRYEGDHFLTRKDLFTRWFIDATYAETRSDDVEELATGETLGGSLVWHRPGKTTTFDLSAGPQVSLLQTDERESGGFGASLGMRVARPVGVHRLAIDWSGSYGQDLFATAGWSFRQAIGATLSGPAATARYSASLRATAHRTHSPVTGEGAGRTISASASLSMRRLNLRAQARLSNGMLGATPEEFTGDGLFLPAPFDSTELDASIAAQLTLFPGLSAKADVHAGRSEVPNRPVLHETAAAAGVTYTYASIGMAVENRMSMTETVDGWDRTNLVMFRVYRSFSW